MAASWLTVDDNNRKVKCMVCGQTCQSWIECDRNVAAASKPVVTTAYNRDGKLVTVCIPTNRD